MGNGRHSIQGPYRLSLGGGQSANLYTIADYQYNWEKGTLSIIGTDGKEEVIALPYYFRRSGGRAYLKPFYSSGHLNPRIKGREVVSFLPAYYQWARGKERKPLMARNPLAMEILSYVDALLPLAIYTTEIVPRDITLKDPRRAVDLAILFSRLLIEGVGGHSGSVGPYQTLPSQHRRVRRIFSFLPSFEKCLTIECQSEVWYYGTYHNILTFSRWVMSDPVLKRRFLHFWRNLSKEERKTFTVILVSALHNMGFSERFMALFREWMGQGGRFSIWNRPFDEEFILQSLSVASRSSRVGPGENDVGKYVRSTLNSWREFSSRRFSAFPLYGEVREAEEVPRLKK